MPTNAKNMVLAELLTRCLIGTTPSKDEIVNTLDFYRTKFSVQVPEEYNENFKDMTADFAKVIAKYFD